MKSATGWETDQDLGHFPTWIQEEMGEGVSNLFIVLGLGIQVEFGLGFGVRVKVGYFFIVLGMG